MIPDARDRAAYILANGGAHTESEGDGSEVVFSGSQIEEFSGVAGGSDGVYEGEGEQGVEAVAGLADGVKVMALEVGGDREQEFGREGEEIHGTCHGDVVLAMVARTPHGNRPLPGNRVNVKDYTSPSLIMDCQLSGLCLCPIVGNPKSYFVFG